MTFSQFRFSKKATKIWQIHQFDLTTSTYLVNHVKSTGRSCKKFVAFLEKLNFRSSKSFVLKKLYSTLSVLRIFVHSFFCHFSCQHLRSSIFFVKLQHSLLDFYHLTNFSILLIFFMTFYSLIPVGRLRSIQVQLRWY